MNVTVNSKQNFMSVNLSKKGNINCLWSWFTKRIAPVGWIDYDRSGKTSRILFIREGVRIHFLDISIKELSYVDFYQHIDYSMEWVF